MESLKQMLQRLDMWYTKQLLHVSAQFFTGLNHELSLFKWGTSKCFPQNVVEFLLSKSYVILVFSKNHAVTQKSSQVRMHSCILLHGAPGFLSHSHTPPETATQSAVFSVIIMCLLGGILFPHVLFDSWTRCLHGLIFTWAFWPSINSEQWSVPGKERGGQRGRLSLTVAHLIVMLIARPPGRPNCIVNLA